MLASAPIVLLYANSFYSFDRTLMSNLILYRAKDVEISAFSCRTQLYLVVERNLIGADLDHVLGNHGASRNQQNNNIILVYWSKHLIEPMCLKLTLCLYRLKI